MIDFSNSSWRETIFMASLATFVGVVSSYASMGFLWAINSLHLLFLGVKGNQLYAHLESISAWHLFILPVVGAVIVRLIIQYGMPENRNHGPADAIEAARLGTGDMSIKAGIGSAVASIVSIGSGASVGRYGPAVHLGASLGSWLAQLLKLTAEHKRTLLACGVAGAISASFSAPLAGVVFAHEAVLGRFGSKSVMSIVIASVVASAIVKIHAFDSILFMLPDMPRVANWEYFLFALVGVIGGALAVIYMSMMYHFSRFAQLLPISAMAKAVLGGMLLGGIVVIFPQTFGLGEQVIRDAFQSELTAGVLVMLVLAKLLATSVSFAAGFSGGVFGPAIFLGAMMGTVFGIGAQELVGITVSPAVYGVVGMGAVISRVIGAPITTILIVFELTGSYSLMTAVMVSVVVGGTVTREFFNRSYFYHQLRVRGMEPETSQIQQILSEMSVAALISKPGVVLTADMTLTAARAAVVESDSSVKVVYVTDSKGQLVGEITAAVLYGIDEKMQKKRIDSVLLGSSIVFTTKTNVYEAYLQSKGFKGESIPVMDSHTHQFVGVVYVSELVNACLQAFERFRIEER
ncbi:chloride channel protein [Nitrosomonas sp.]|uniref:chloride channel protein n=1 Tax=Nitrosomonas sp. TaxID=42353 RepID=UPI00208BDEC3|nr:chloride channel protein [Nitrosomonas sp.]GJL74821.1 MAG: transport integral membrane protein [Nitrosomonas sp.]